MPPGLPLPVKGRATGRNALGLFRRDDVKKTSRHIAAPVSFRLLGPPVRIPDEGERQIALARRLDRGIVKLMPAQKRAFGAQRMGPGKACLPVAEMQLAFRKAERRIK